jgi:mono/diheme cytochrome c family protein
MTRNMTLVAGLLAGTMVGCGRAEAPAARQSGEETEAHAAGGAGAAGTGAEAKPGAPPAPTPGAMPMGGGMGERHRRMMGGGSPEDAPQVEAAEARASGCPDIAQEVVDRGREVFAGAGNCFTCHGGDARGTSLAPDLTDGEWLNVDGSYGSIADVVRTGVSGPQRFPVPMPPMGGASLPPADVCAVAAYVYSLSR